MRNSSVAHFLNLSYASNTSLDETMSLECLPGTFSPVMNELNVRVATNLGADTPAPTHLDTPFFFTKGSSDVVGALRPLTDEQLALPAFHGKAFRFAMRGSSKGGEVTYKEYNAAPHRHHFTVKARRVQGRRQ